MSLRRLLKNMVLRVFSVIRTLDRTNTVLLTFDDGPHPDVTPAVLDRLKAHGAKGVFFVVGARIQRAPHLLARIIAEGHLIGNHTYSHRLDRDLSLLPYWRDVRRCQEALEELTGCKPTLFRPPMGRVHGASLMAPRMLRLKTLSWSLDSDDWRLRTEEEAIGCGQRLASQVSSGDIVLLHDDNPRVLDVLDQLLPVLVSQGYDLRGGVQLL